MADLDSFRGFVAVDLWRREFEPRTWTARLVGFIQFAVMVGEGFIRDRLLLRASALTYVTVLSIVPLLAIVSAVVTALGVTENVIGPILDQFAAVSPEVAEQLRSFVQNANIAGLGTLGAATLLLTALLAIGNIERALNHIWGVQHDRPWGRKIPDYLAVMIVAPLLLGVGLSMATTVKSQWIVQRLIEFPVFGVMYNLGLSQLPTVMLAGAFAFLYWFMPNASVRPFTALLGGLVAAVGVNAALGVYVGFSVGAARANVLYGTFAQLPLFFAWVYLFWAIVLFGAEIAFAYQNLPLYRREARGREPGPAQREAVGLRIAVDVARAFRDGSEPWSAEALSEDLNVPVRTVRDVLVHLSDAGVVTRLDESEQEEGYQLGRPAERILVTDVLTALRGAREPVRGGGGVAPAVESLLAELDEGAAKGAAGQTLADLAAQVPPTR